MNTCNNLFGAAIDSQCLSYLLDAINGIKEPTDHLAIERKSLVRSYMYIPGTFSVTSTVKDECLNIADTHRRDQHTSYIDITFSKLPDIMEPYLQQINNRVKDIYSFHPKRNDCFIIAECEFADLKYFLTYDFDLINNLKKHVQLNILKPSLFWELQKIDHGSKPNKIPDWSNPLHAWWKW